MSDKLRVGLQRSRCRQFLLSALLLLQSTATSLSVHAHGQSQVRLPGTIAETAKDFADACSDYKPLPGMDKLPLLSKETVCGRDLNKAYGSMGQAGLVRAISALASMYAMVGRTKDAQLVYEHALKLADETLGERDVAATAAAERGLAGTLTRTGQHRRAVAVWERNAARLERQYGGGHREAIQSMHELSIAYGAVGDQAKFQSLSARAKELSAGFQPPLYLRTPLLVSVRQAALAAFPKGSSELTTQTKASLEEFVSEMRGVKLEVMVFVGQADPLEFSDDSTRLALSSARAREVRLFVTSRGLNALKMYDDVQVKVQTPESGQAPLSRVRIEFVGTRAQ